MDGPTLTILAILGAMLFFSAPFIISDWLGQRKKK